MLFIIYSVFVSSSSSVQDVMKTNFSMEGTPSVICNEPLIQEAELVENQNIAKSMPSLQLGQGFSMNLTNSIYFCNIFQESDS